MQAVDRIFTRTYHDLSSHFYARTPAYDRHYLINGSVHNVAYICILYLPGVSPHTDDGEDLCVFDVRPSVTQGIVLQCTRACVAVWVLVRVHPHQQELSVWTFWVVFGPKLTCVLTFIGMS